MNEEKCPCCSNHCDKDNLGCGRGQNYFNSSNESEAKTIVEEVINDLRKCGHMLHHNRDLEPKQFLANFKEEELLRLHELLSKIEK